MHLTSIGLRGFNQGATSEDYGQINAVAFMIACELKDPQGAILDGEVHFACYFGDTDDNVVRQDFTIPFVKDSTDLQHWVDQVLPISGFQAYRANKPWSIIDRGLSNVVAPKQIDIQNIFLWRNTKWMCIQIIDFYDRFDRFSPTGEIDDASNVDLSALLGGTIAITIDAFRFIKPLLVQARAGGTTPNIEPSFLQRPQISLYDQLKNDALSQLDIEQFPTTTYDMKTSGHAMFNIPFGETFFLKNDQIVFNKSRNESAINQDDGEANTVRLVAKTIEYSLTKPTAGEGGLTRRILGSRRFV